jgi:SAM-dependent methyltransferase
MSAGDATDRSNRRYWDDLSAAIEAQAGSTLDTLPEAWGLFRVPEAELGLLGEVRGRRILDLGCGGARWALALATRGGCAVGLDFSSRQLQVARRVLERDGARMPLVQATATSLPFAACSFDIVLSDHGAMSWCDPELTIPEVARVLRPDGVLVFCAATAFAAAHIDDDDELTLTLRNDYHGMRRRPRSDGGSRYTMGHADLIRTFHRSGLAIVDLIELRPPVNGENVYEIDLDWARRWPFEEIWRVRRE